MDRLQEFELTRQLMQHINDAITKWYAEQLETGLSRDDLMKVINDAMTAFYMALKD